MDKWKSHKQTPDSRLDFPQANRPNPHSKNAKCPSLPSPVFFASASSLTSPSAYPWASWVATRGGISTTFLTFAGVTPSTPSLKPRSSSSVVACP
ncbi:hypothetical protein BC937DRAFT_91404 [Endogone sp. FLAS-F59071]|nr:hypothetical protein BC937DRAFT_91404 [Endogone sp. FLAS-F59071]|eukprot:RUS16292.1 hypothetical protein BC937DRAFT_91404 [Endogone sp. FLAS-F59071]